MLYCLIKSNFAFILNYSTQAPNCSSLWHGGYSNIHCCVGGGGRCMVCMLIKTNCRRNQTLPGQTKEFQSNFTIILRHWRGICCYPRLIPPTTVNKVVANIWPLITAQAYITVDNKWLTQNGTPPLNENVSPSKFLFA